MIIHDLSDERDQTPLIQKVSRGDDVFFCSEYKELYWLWKEFPRTEGALTHTLSSGIVEFVLYNQKWPVGFKYDIIGAIFPQIGVTLCRPNPLTKPNPDGSLMLANLLTALLIQIPQLPIKQRRASLAQQLISEFIDRAVCKNVIIPGPVLEEIATTVVAHQ